MTIVWRKYLGALILIIGVVINKGARLNFAAFNTTLKNFKMSRAELKFQGEKKKRRG